MSKLFEAISNLEADNGQAVVDSPFRVETTGFSDVKSRGRSRKILAIAIGILIITLAAGSGALFLLKKLAVSNRNPVSGQELATEKGLKGKIMSAVPVAMKGQPETIKNHWEDSPKTKVEKKEEVTVMAQENEAPKKKNGTDSALVSPLKKETSISTGGAKAAISGLNRQLKGDSWPKPLHGAMKPVPLASNPLILNGHEKRLLYRAEKLRKLGLKEQALAIYQRVWEKSRNPLVANNLAALLMDKGRYEKALKILEQAAKVSPLDEDIKYNLEQLRLFLGKTETLSR